MLSFSGVAPLSRMKGFLVRRTWALWFVLPLLLVAVAKFPVLNAQNTGKPLKKSESTPAKGVRSAVKNSLESRRFPSTLLENGLDGSQFRPRPTDFQGSQMRPCAIPLPTKEARRDLCSPRLPDDSERSTCCYTPSSQARSYPMPMSRWSSRWTTGGFWSARCKSLTTL